MKTRLLKWQWFVVSVVAVASVRALADTASDSASDARKSFEKTRLQLQERGFKTDLTNFDFSTTPDLRAREQALSATAPNRNDANYVNNPPEHPDLMEPVGTNEATVVWKEKTLRRQTPSWPDGSYEVAWDDFDDVINQKRSQIDAACAAILAGPISFNLVASNGSAMLLPHLANLKNLTQVLNDRAVLALHRGNLAAAWTNLMAATRLVTAWNPEPVEISHRVRFTDAKLVFKATWQALQTNGWTDNELASLQHEWETADFLSHLSEIQAFRRACDLKALEQDTTPDISDDETYEDKELLLLFYRDREMEYRNAVQAGIWQEMRAMPGVTNEIFFEPKYHSGGRFATRLHMSRIGLRFANEGKNFLGQAAEAESERRVLMAAFALERYHGKYKHYPETLQALTPEFLKSAPADFMTGQPLHYRVIEGGHFILYSAGLDCTDNGGRIETRVAPDERFAMSRSPNASIPASDIVWPLTASSTEVVAQRKQQMQAEADRKKQREAEAKEQEKINEREQEEARRAAMKKLLAEKPSLGKEPVYDGKPLSSWVDKVGEIERYDGAPKDAVQAIQTIGPKAVPFLLEWMPSPGAEKPVEGYPDWDDIDVAWWALGTKGKAAIPELTRRITRPVQGMDDNSVWTESAKAISHLGPDAIVPMLTVATNMQGKHELGELLHNFENLGTNGAPAVPALIHWANDPDYWVRDGVVSALGGIGERADLAVPVLLNALLHDSNSMVRRDAAQALGTFATNSEVVLPELSKTLTDSDWEARAGALAGLGRMQTKPELVVPLITPFLYDKNNVVQRSAAYALRDLGSKAGYNALLQASNAPSSWPGIGDIIYEVQKKMEGEKAQ